MSLNKVRFVVCGSQYVVATAEDENYVQGLADRLDKDMQAVMEASPSASVAMAAVVTAMDYLDEMQKASNGADNMRGQIKDYLEDAAKARMEAEDARRDAERMRRQLEDLQKKVAVNEQ